MPILARLRARAHQVVDRLNRRPAPVSPRPAEPASATLGALVMRPLLPAPAELPDTRWDLDPATGAALPTGPAEGLPGVGFRAARALHRQAWLPALIRAGEADEAWARLESWLRQDLPGQGVAWIHPTDAAVRLVHWHAALSLAPAPEALRALLAGSAAWHLQILEARMPRPEATHRFVAHCAGLVVGGFTFPGVDGAATAWSHGVSRLGEVVGTLADADGGDPDLAPAFYAQSLWFLAIARAVARGNGSTLPADVEVAWTRGAHALGALAGGVGRLPELGDDPGLPMLPFDYPLAWSLRNLALAWGLDEGDPAPRAEEDPRCALFGVSPPTVESVLQKRDLKATEHYRGARAKTMPAPPRGWDMWTWRGAGLAAAHFVMKGLPARVVFAAGADRGRPWTHPAALQLLFDVGPYAVIADPGAAKEAGELEAWARSAAAHGSFAPVGEMDLARVDGRKARIDGHAGEWRRSVLLQQQRVVVSDRLQGPVRLCWQLGPGWALSPQADGWLLSQGPLKVVVQLPEALRWTVVTGRGGEAPGGWVLRDGERIEAPMLVGEGEADGLLQCSFEVR